MVAGEQISRSSLAMRTLASALVALAIGTGVAGAQTPAAPVTAPMDTAQDQGPLTRVFVLTPRAGALSFAKTAGLERAATLGLDAQYQLTKALSIGTNVTFGRANTRGSDFLTTLTYGVIGTGDTTLFFNLTQPVSMVDAQLAGTFQLPMAGRIAPFLTAGGGVYAFYLDPEANGGRTKFVGPSATVGGGVKVRLSRSAGIQLDVRDMVMARYDREKLRPSDERFGNPMFGEDFAVPPAAKRTIHNLMFNIGFNFTPTFRSGSSGAEDDARRPNSI
jgi:hypothetical protein